jgi:hypothetical protein
MDTKNVNARSNILQKIFKRENDQVPNKSSSIEPLLMFVPDNYHYGRWFIGRDSKGNAINRERKAGLTPRFHDHSYTDDMYINDTYITEDIEPEFHFQYPTETHHRHWKKEVNMYR